MATERFVVYLNTEVASELALFEMINSQPKGRRQQKVRQLLDAGMRAIVDEPDSPPVAVRPAAVPAQLPAAPTSVRVTPPPSGEEPTPAPEASADAAQSGKATGSKHPLTRLGIGQSAVTTS